MVFRFHGSKAAIGAAALAIALASPSAYAEVVTFTLSGREVGSFTIDTANPFYHNADSSEAFFKYHFISSSGIFAGADYLNYFSSKSAETISLNNFYPSDYSTYIGNPNGGLSIIDTGTLAVPFFPAGRYTTSVDLWNGNAPVVVTVSPRAPAPLVASGFLSALAALAGLAMTRMTRRSRIAA